MSGTPDFDSGILAYYNRGREAERLESALPRLEYVRTLDVLERYLPKPPATVLDIGGGPGRYAYWLAERGHEVKLLDPVPLHVEQARDLLAGYDDAAVSLGDARNLPYVGASAEVVLLLGPLYHLPEKTDRQAILEEAYRILKPGGLLFAAISRFAGLLDGLFSGALSEPDFVDIVSNFLETGVHRNPEGREGLFTTAYFHLPKDLEHELTEAGFKNVVLIGLEGPGRYLHDFDAVWEDDVRRKALLELTRKVETEPSLLGSSSHIMAIAQK